MTAPLFVAVRKFVAVIAITTCARRDVNRSADRGDAAARAESLSS
jgi:hypothetical protein